jgi:hypothetical protein
MTRQIKIGENYSLDLGSSCPINVKVLEIKNNKILCLYLNSTYNRKEWLDEEFF